MIIQYTSEYTSKSLLLLILTSPHRVDAPLQLIGSLTLLPHLVDTPSTADRLTFSPPPSRVDTPPTSDWLISAT